MFAADWTLKEFGEIPFAQILYHPTEPLEGAYAAPNTGWTMAGMEDHNTVIINSDTKAIKTEYRDYTTLDFFPTILASMGCTIDGNRLGLGTNLFSSALTLSELLGREEFLVR